MLQNRDKNGAEPWMIGGISLSEGGKDKLSSCDETVNKDIEMVICEGGACRT